VGMLTTLLSGAAYGSELGNMVTGPTARKDGHLFIAIDVAGFQPVDNFKRRVDKVSGEIRTSRRRQGVERLYPPGLLEAEFETRYAKKGIPLNKETLAGIRAAGRQVGVAEDRLPLEGSGA